MKCLDEEIRRAEVELARASSRRDTDAQRELVGRLLDRVSLTVNYLAYGHRDVDDMIQLSLIEVLKSAGSFRGESTLESWAVRITVRTAARVLKQRRFRDNIVILRRRQAPSRMNPEDELRRGQLRRRMALLLQKLSIDRRAAVVLKLVHGYSIREIAGMTSSPVNTVRDRLRKGRKQLRKYILNDPVLRDWADERTA